MPAFLHLSIWGQVLCKCSIFPKDLIQVCEMEGPKEILSESNLHRHKLQEIYSLRLPFKLLNAVFYYSSSFSHPFWFIFVLCVF